MQKSIDFGGHPFRLTVNALCDFEERSGKSAMRLGVDDPVGAKDLLLLVAVGLEAGTGEPVSLEKAGQLIDEMTIPVAAQLVGQAMEIGLGVKESLVSG